MNSFSLSESKHENFKQIEDIIDARKRLGQYNVYKPSKSVFSKCSCKSTEENKIVTFNEASFLLNDKESSIAGPSDVKYTDSEITIVKVKCNRDIFKRKLNSWDMNDIAIPGDGSHFGESPSMVNLVTLVAQNVQCEGDDEYLVPLSSWDPIMKGEIDESETNIKCMSDTQICDKNKIRKSPTDLNIHSKLGSSENNSQTDFTSDDKIYRLKLAGKFSKFWRTRSNCQDESITKKM